jgi:hypothetical protein
MGHRGKDTISPNEDMLDHKCSPLSNSPDRGRHLQHCLDTFHSFGRPVPPQLHTDSFPAHRGDPPLASIQNDFSQQRNRAGQMLQGLQTCLLDQRFLMMHSMQIMSVIIPPTWAGLKAKHKSA